MRRACADRIRALIPVVSQPPTQWLSANLTLDRDATAASRGRLRLDPYQREPIEAAYDPAVRLIAVQAPEQTGKSMIWRALLVWFLANVGGPALIIYPSDEAAAEANKDTLRPLLDGIPELAADLERPFAVTNGAYHFRRSVVYFAGAGSPIISKPIRLAIGDEINFWSSAIAENLRNLEKRTRTYYALGRSLQILCSSPTNPTDAITRIWERGSKGVWHLRCAGCNALHPSHDLRLLQWEMSGDHQPVWESLRLICPLCKREHLEAEAKAINEAGAYIHADDANRVERTFQWGALASPRTLSWRQIAAAMVDSGKSAGEEAHRYLDNSIRGLPFHRRREDKPQQDALLAHRGNPPDPERLIWIGFSADTQNDCWYWMVRGLDDDDNTYLLGCGRAVTPADLDAAWNAKYAGVQPCAGIIDQGGPRAKEIQEFCKTRPGLFSYKGMPQATLTWKRSNEDPKLLLAAPKVYQARLLYAIYSQTDRKNHYWYLPPEVDPDYARQMTQWRPNKRMRNGHEYEQWEPPDPTHPDDHYADAEKQWLVLLDFAVTSYRPGDWLRPNHYSAAQTRVRPTVKLPEVE